MEVDPLLAVLKVELVSGICHEPLKIWLGTSEGPFKILKVKSRVPST